MEWGVSWPPCFVRSSAASGASGLCFVAKDVLLPAALAPRSSEPCLPSSSGRQSLCRWSWGCRGLVAAGMTLKEVGPSLSRPVARPLPSPRSLSAGCSGVPGVPRPLQSRAVIL